MKKLKKRSGDVSNDEELTYRVQLKN